jgi:NAD-dependent deacetylase
MRFTMPVAEITAKPNAAHFALDRLETALAERGGNLTLVTQNIDDLHERAGSKCVIHNARRQGQLVS